MTSQKSLKNNVNRNDFVRSLTGSILFPAIALVVLFIAFTFPIISYVTSEAFLTTMEHEEVSMFVLEYSLGGDMFSLFPVCMVICGMLTAIKSFYFMLSKKQVNVFFSLGVTRKTMFINRILAGIIALFVSVLIPMLIIYIVNITKFGYVAHATQIFLYAVSMFFVSGLAGFAIGAMATMIGGNIFEVALTSFTASAFPVLTVNAGSSIVNAFLNGHSNNGDGIHWYGLISPWNICSSIFRENSDIGYNILRQPIDIFLPLTRNGVEADKYVIPDSAKVGISFVAPILSWLAISVVLIAIGYVLYKARKAEHANSLGHFAISRAINTTFVFLLMAFLICEMFYYEISPISYFLILAVAGVAVYFVLQLIMTRKLKTTFKSLKWYGVLVSVTAIALVVVCTGLFGTYNRTPDKSEIKSVSIDAYELEPYVHFLNHDQTEDFVEATSDNAKEAIISIFDKVKNEKVQYGEDSFLGVTFAFRDNNNELKYRTFSIYSEEVFVEYLKVVYGSDFFDEILKEYLINDPPEKDEEDMLEYYEENGVLYYFGDENNSAGYLKTKSWSFISNIGVYEFYESDIPETNSTPMVEWVEDTETLCKALYNDLTKMSYEQLFERTEKPIGVLAKGSAANDFMGAYCMHNDTVIIADSAMAIESKYALVYDGIPVYADMTETVAFLKANGYMANVTELTVKEVLYTDSPLNIDNALQEFYKANENTYDERSGYHYWIYDTVKDVTFTSGDLIWHTFEATGSFINNEQLSNIDTLKRVYKDAGHPLTSVTDVAKAEAIAEKSVSQYMVSGDNGRYVYVIYEEGPIVCYYLPEANVSVLK